MYLKTLHLRQFRNYRDQQVEFSAPKTILVGSNAQGKSNLLEAVELLSTLRSQRTSRDRDLIRDEEPVGQITATLVRDSGPLDLALTLRGSGRRSVAINSEFVRRHLDFLGALNVVRFSSLDLDLVRGGPGERRDWLDTVLIQLEPVYAHLLQRYSQVLRQRNTFLKQQQAASITHTDSTQLDLWNTQLAAAGSRIIQRRTRMLKRLAPLANAWHQAISGRLEDLEVKYAPNVDFKDFSHSQSVAKGLSVSEGEGPGYGLYSASEHSPPLDSGNDSQVSSEMLRQAFLAQIQQKAIAEYHQGTTLVGPHRDEVELIINQTPARQYGSQGQQRTLVLALKLAELKLIEEVIGEPPLLLLDDVLAELDLNRQNQLLDAIQDRFQTLITTTHLGAFDFQWLNSAQILSVEAGKIS